MLRHVIAPAQNFTQVPNEILRHPRLNADAVRLLAWQLSLHPEARQSLSKTAEHAGIRKRAFQRAKTQLLDEGFLHEWRQQRERDHWLTVQLVSNLPLSPAEALRALDDLPQHVVQVPDEKPQVAPSAPQRAAGEPTRRAVGRQPRKDVVDDTTHPPAPETAPDTAPRGDSAHRREAEDLLVGLSRTAPALAMPRKKARKWASKLVPWLEGGLSHDQIRHALTQGMSNTHSPMGVPLWRLSHARPDAPAPAVPARLTGMRECEGVHTHPRLCRPVPGAERVYCPQCRTAPAPDTGTGYAAFRAARAALTA